MEVTPQILSAKVMHKRLHPKVNQFTYRVYYLALPLSQRDLWAQHLAHNRFGFLSVYDKDHGARNGSDLESWLRAILEEYGLNNITKEIVLVAMPRVLGYGFNPVSFWLCLDEQGHCRAILNEVHNTFGEAHSYLCAHQDQHALHQNDWLSAQKLLHVSPFLPREGSYQFRYALGQESMGVWINYQDANGNDQLLTSLNGRLSPLTQKNLRQVVLRHPLVTLKTIGLIHWQALKLFAKGVRYIVKPQQLQPSQSHSDNLTKLS